MYVSKTSFVSTTLPTAKKREGKRVSTEVASRLLFTVKDSRYCYDNMLGK